MFAGSGDSGPLATSQTACLNLSWTRLTVAAAPVVRRPFLAGYRYPFRHRSPSQVLANQPQHPFVPDRSSDPAHQNVVIDVVEELRDVLALERFQRLYLSPDKLWFGECPWSTPPSPCLPAHTSARPARRPVLCAPAETRNCARCMPDRRSASALVTASAECTGLVP